MTSGAVDDAQAIEHIAANNRICVSQAEQLKALQRWAQQIGELSK